MIITKDNIGDVICTYKNGKRIMIADVDDTHVYFFKEHFERICCINRFALEGVKDPSPYAVTDFLSHLTFADTLANATKSADKKWFKGSLEDRKIALEKFAKISAQREDFENNLNEDAENRKEMLLDCFLSDIETLQPGEKVFFYKNKVEKAEVIDGYVVNGIEVEKNDIKKALMEGEKVKTRKLSFDEIVNSAKSRYDNQLESTKSRIVNKETLEIGE